MATTKDTPHAAVFLIYTAVILSVMEYFFLPMRAETWLNGEISLRLRGPSLTAGLIWSASCIVGFFLIPSLYAISQMKMSLPQLGLSPEGFRAHLKTYLLLFTGMIPVIYFASTQAEFARLYPFVPEAKSSLTKFFVWEIAYVLQFFALESFFRGSLLFTLEKQMNKWTAIAVMVVPYTMIHFHKPFLETLGAVIAGCFLGWLSLRYRSWLGGAILHSLVAITMDTIAAARAGSF